MRQRDGSHAVLTRNRFRIRRDHILEDAFSQLNALSEEDLRGSVISQLICLYNVYLSIHICAYVYDFVCTTLVGISVPRRYREQICVQIF